jgi:glycosyltransferase involved in cell wall biosynthesis
MKIAVYAIALNEEQFVKRWYESAKDADYLLIADTGSTDKTVKLAKSLGIKGAPSYVVNGIFIPGLIDKERFTAIIGEVRQIAAQTQNTEKTGINNDLTAPEDQKSEDPK